MVVSGQSRMDLRWVIFSIFLFSFDGNHFFPTDPRPIAIFQTGTDTRLQIQYAKKLSQRKVATLLLPIGCCHFSHWNCIENPLVSVKPSRQWFSPSSPKDPVTRWPPETSNFDREKNPLKNAIWKKNSKFRTNTVKEKMDEIIFFFLCSCVEVCVDDLGDFHGFFYRGPPCESGENLIGFGFSRGKTGSKIELRTAIYKNCSGNQTGIHCRPLFTSMYFSIFFSIYGYTIAMNLSRMTLSSWCGSSIRWLLRQFTSNERFLVSRNCEKKLVKKNFLPVLNKMASFKYRLFCKCSCDVFSFFWLWGGFWDWGWFLCREFYGDFQRNWIKKSEEIFKKIPSNPNTENLPDPKKERN